MATNNETEKLRSLALSVIALGVLIAGLVVGRSFLIPLAIAILLWNLLEALIDGFSRIGVGRVRLPRWFSATLAFGAVVLFLYLFVAILLSQADAIADAVPRYEERLEAIIANVGTWLGPELSTQVGAGLSKIDIVGQVKGVLVSAQSFILSAILVCLYVGFLLLDSGYVGNKLAAIFPIPEQARELDGMLSAMSDGIRRYIWIKTLVSAATGTISYVVLRAMGLDFAETWALLIFFLNYIPNIGSVVGVAFPAVLALVQFHTIEPFIVIALALTVVQMIAGNVVEPMLMGKSLNLSSFSIILSLTFWGTIWGIIGMFLSVPIIVLVMIVCANVPSWRWIAILLSKDGRIETVLR